MERAKEVVGKFLDHWTVIAFMTFVTIYALFWDDIRVLTMDKSHDFLFDVITLVFTCLFAIEISLAVFAQKDYLFSFFFWLDIIATISMILDCGIIIDSSSSDENATSASPSDLAKTSKAGRVTRIIRIIRLIRLIRIVKLYKQSQLAQQAVKHRKGHKNKVEVEKKDDDDELADVPEESKISKVLSDSYIKTIIILVLSMLLMVQMVSTDTYIQDVSFHMQGLGQQAKLYETYEEAGYDSYKKSLNHYIDEARGGETERFPLIFLSVPGMVQGNKQEETIYEWEPKMEQLRPNEYNSVYLTAADGTEFIASYSVRDRVRIESFNDLFRTLFICLVLSFASIYINSDARTLVLDPLERIIEKVKFISQDPIAAVSEDVAKAGVHSYA